MSKIVLVTGCSTGIGRDLAQRLTQAGYTVAATARQVDALHDLPAALKLSLDVTRPDTVHAAVAQTIQQFGRIDALVNNAGYALLGALEEVADEQVQQLFDVNVFGTLRMVRAVAPYMRQQGAGRIINISSIAGRLSTPVNGPYSATKFAVEALSDALRLELAPFGIQVVVIEPGSIKTRFDDTARACGEKIISNPGSPYLPLYQKSEQFAAAMVSRQSGPEAVSQVIQRAIEAPRPKARYLAAVALPGRIVLLLRDLVWGTALRRIFQFEPVGREAE
jgi:NAD(P)-dependent dehydrogenase (short-subunit alcohol dehydrogenase family)